MAFDSKQIAKKLEHWIQIVQEKKLFRNIYITYRWIWNTFLILICLGVIGLFFAGGLAAGYFASLVHDEKIPTYNELNQEINQYNETTAFYFSKDVPLGKLRTDLIRSNVSLNQVSPNVAHAVISTEDELFYKHNGVVPRAVFRAGYQELTHQPVVTGGSTLTQQLVKNQILTNEVSFERKAKEMLLAIRVEQFFTKDEILQDYLNVVPFGRNAAGQNIAGISAAAKGIFDVKPSELNIPQAAFIAGLPKNPFSYTPFKNSGGIKDDISSGVSRAHFVLSRMKDAGYINQKQYQDALNYDYKKHFSTVTKDASQKYPSLMTELKGRTQTILAKLDAKKQGYSAEKLYKDHELYKKAEFEAGAVYKNTSLEQVAKLKHYNLPQLKKHYDLFNEFLKNANNQMSQNGFRVYSTINKEIYDGMKKAAKTYPNYEENKLYKHKDPNTGDTISEILPMEVGAMMIKNDTGEIISFVAGHDYKHSQVNHATKAIRQIGSSMKPLMVYGPGLETGIIQPGTIVGDFPFKKIVPSMDEPYIVHNYTPRYHGFESARLALDGSHNTPAVRLLSQLFSQNKDPGHYLEEMGITTLAGSDKYNLSSALGGLSHGMTVEENTNAYTTFANDGNFIDAFMISKIVDQNGKVIYQHKTPKPKQVFSPQTSYLMLDMMRGVINNPIGTARSLNGYLNFRSDLAGKTGTTNNYKDNWFIGTNPNITMGIWTGYDKVFSLNPHVYSQHTLQLWARFANAAYKVAPDLVAPSQRFTQPAGIDKATFCGITTQKVTDLCKKAGFVETDLFNDKYLPSEYGHALVIKNGGITLTDEALAKYFPYINKPEMTDALWGTLNPHPAVKKEAPKEDPKPPATKPDKPTDPKPPATKPDKPTDPKPSATKPDKPADPKPPATKPDKPTDPKPPATKPDKPTDPKPPATN